MAVSDAVLKISARTSGINEVKELNLALRSLDKAGSTIRATFASAAVALGAVSTAQIVGELVRAGNEAELVARRINAVAGTFGEVAGVYDLAAKAAQRFAIGQTDAQSSVANLYNRLRPMGVTLAQIEDVFMGVNKAAQLGGLTALDASEAFRQLGQAMGSGRLQGDELRALGERMPAVLQAVAKVMGVTVGEVKKLGSEGEITTDILIKAAAELNNLTPPEPTALARYKQATADLVTTLSVGLAPIITPVIQGLTRIASVLAISSQWLTSNKEAVKAFTDETFKAIGVVAKLAVATGVALVVFKAVNAALKIKIALQKASLIVETFAASLSPKRAALTLAAIGVGAVAAIQLDKKLKEIMGNMPTLDLSASNIAQNTNQIAAAVSATGVGLAAATGPAKTLKELEEERKNLYDQYVARLSEEYSKQSTISDLLSKRAEQRGEAAQNQLSIEEAQIGVARAYLDNRMALAKTDQERRAITLEIIELDRKAAAAQYQAAIAQIQVERDLSNLRTLEAERKLRQALEELRIAQALGTVTAQIQANAQSARSALMSAAVENAGVDKTLAARQRIAALNLEAANVGLQGRRQQLNATRPGQPIQLSGATIYPTQLSGGVIPQYAKGGFVTSPTLAQIGEGGEAEYVVPQSKAKNFAANVLTGTSGEQAVQRRNPYLIALQTLANDPGAYIRAADAFAPKGGWGRTEAEVFQGRQRALQSLGIGLERGFHFGGGSYRITKGVDVKAIRRAVEREASGGGGSAGASMSTMPRQVVNNIQTGPVQRRTDGDFVTLSDLERAVASAVDQTMAAVQKTARQPGYKRRTGSR